METPTTLECFRLFFVSIVFVPLVVQVANTTADLARKSERTLHSFTNDGTRLSLDVASDGTIDQMKRVPVSPLTDFIFDFQDLLFTPVVK
jgi:hypothetical protein